MLALFFFEIGFAICVLCDMIDSLRSHGLSFANSGTPRLVSTDSEQHHQIVTTSGEIGLVLYSAKAMICVLGVAEMCLVSLPWKDWY